MLQRVAVSLCRSQVEGHRQQVRYATRGLRLSQTWGTVSRTARLLRFFTVWHTLPNCLGLSMQKTRSLLSALPESLRLSHGVLVGILNGAIGAGSDPPLVAAALPQLPHR